MLFDIIGYFDIMFRSNIPMIGEKGCSALLISLKPCVSPLNDENHGVEE